jgi:hypothetical protein
MRTTVARAALAKNAHCQPAGKTIRGIARTAALQPAGG